MRISDWSSDVCSSDLPVVYGCLVETESGDIVPLWPERWPLQELIEDYQEYFEMGLTETWLCEMMNMPGFTKNGFRPDAVYYRPTPLQDRSEEHTSELQSLMRIWYAVFHLKKKKINIYHSTLCH